MPEVQFKVKCDTRPGDRVVVVGSDNAIGSWDPVKSSVELKTDAKSYPWWLGRGILGGAFEFKFAILGNGGARWENTIGNRSLAWATPVKIEAEFDRSGAVTAPLKEGSEPPNQATQPPRPSPAPAAAPAAPPSAPAAPAPPAAFLPQSRGGGAAVGAVVQRIAEEDAKRKSWRNKLDLSRSLLEGGDIGALSQLACLQAYLTWVASGQIKCQEDGSHNRPCAHADASRKISAMLWQFADRGDAERFIARRIFPALPSYADQFTCAVPMTRIRDIAHRGDIPHELKQEIKHTLQNKLHRCADPNDMKTCENLINKCRNENRYSAAFMREFETFYVELKEFFNAGGLDEQAQQIAGADGSLRGTVDQFLQLKHSNARPEHQLASISELRRLVAPRVEAEQAFLLFDLKLEEYSFMLLSQLAHDLESHGQGSTEWWQRLLDALQLALRQSELARIAPEECRAVASDAIGAARDVGDSSKAPFVWLRLAAAADRTLRICFGLTQKLEGAYTDVPALGQALHIDAHAISVFVEAEMRNSILFQVSKFAQLTMQQAKRAANLPNWTAISAGSATGRVVRCGALSEAWAVKLPEEGGIVFCEDAGGDEELPPNCSGVVVARDLPVLSHLALRARQLGAVFGCTSERPLFDALLAKAGVGSAARLTVHSAGDVQLEGAAESELLGRKAGTDADGTDANGKSPKNGKVKAQVGLLNATVTKVTPAKELADRPQTAGSKVASSGKLEAIGDAVGFKAPMGLAVPFGVMTKAVNNTGVGEAVSVLQKALDENSGKIESLALAARAAVQKCTVPKDVVDAIIKGLPKGTERIAVRSSANSEDLEGVSGAGLHDSVLGVSAKDSEEVEKAVQEVWGSMFTLRAVQSRFAAGMPLFNGVAMGVLVQPMVSLAGAAYAFIAFSKHVVENDPGSVYIEVCVGLGETLASANEPGTPYRLVVQKAAPHAVKILSLASFSYGLEDVDGGPKPRRVDYSKEMLSTDQPFLEKVAREVASVAAKVEDQYQTPMDMEGVVLDHGSSREIHLVQARPIVEG